MKVAFFNRRAYYWDACALLKELAALNGFAVEFDAVVGSNGLDASC